jgi:ABC-type transporter Mla subunit MlaD
MSLYPSPITHYLDTFNIQHLTPLTLPPSLLPTTYSKKVSRVDVQDRLDSLESIVQQIGEAVLATTETIDRLSDRMDALVNQVQQQGYQNFALTDAVQTITEVQQESLKRLDKVSDALERLVRVIEQSDT